jgi:transmembrane sensor
MTGTAFEQAAAWMARRQGGEDIAADPAFAVWHAGHRQVWAEAERLWSGFDAAPDPLLDAMRVVALQARPERPARGRLVAAVLCAVAAAVAIVLVPRHGAAPEPVARYATAPDQRREVVLADGTRIAMDGGTRIAVTLAGDRRRVALDGGEAYFAVVHDARRPFSVAVAGLEIVDLGTEFDVRDSRPGARVVLVRGQVDVRSGADAVRLSPGQVLETGPQSWTVRRGGDLAPLLAWRSGYLDLRGETVGRAIDEMNRHNRKAIILDDPASRALPITGRFPANDREGFARALVDLYGLKLHHRPDGSIVLTPGR